MEDSRPRVRARSTDVSHFVIIGVVAALLVAREAHADDHGPDTVDGIGVLGIVRHAELYGDATYEHADGSDAIALVPGARIAIGDVAFLEGRIPLGYGLQPGALALGNVTVALGLLPAHQRLVALALRVAGPTSPRLGDGMTTAIALAAPRLADPELFLPHTSSAELVADWRWRGDTTWVQAELGLAGWWEPSPTRYLTVLRATAAGGVHVDRHLELTASFVTRSFLLTDKKTENFVHSLMLGVVAHDDRGQVTLRLEVPIDDSARNVNRFVVGLEFRGR
jgi:hypothetical protein